MKASEFMRSLETTVQAACAEHDIQANLYIGEVITGRPALKLALMRDGNVVRGVLPNNIFLAPETFAAFVAGVIDEFEEQFPKKYPKILAVDFDGCLVENAWPRIGKPQCSVINAVKQRKRDGWKVILWTCRSGKMLDDAVEWCRRHGIELDAVNDNLPEVQKAYGGNPRKITATEYWDDRGREMHDGVFPTSGEEGASR